LLKEGLNRNINKFGGIFQGVLTYLLWKIIKKISDIFKMSIIDSKCFALNDTGKSVQIFPILIDMFCISARYPGCMGGWGGHNW
jgi:hypothetical protein